MIILFWLKSPLCAEENHLLTRTRLGITALSGPVVHIMYSWVLLHVNRRDALRLERRVLRARLSTSLVPKAISAPHRPTHVPPRPLRCVLRAARVSKALPLRVPQRLLRHRHGRHVASRGVHYLPSRQILQLLAWHQRDSGQLSCWCLLPDRNSHRCPVGTYNSNMSATALSDCLVPPSARPATGSLLALSNQISFLFAIVRSQRVHSVSLFVPVNICDSTHAGSLARQAPSALRLHPV